MSAQHTLGPWNWNVHRKARQIYLESPSGYVMGFQRWGMTGAQPNFISLDRSKIEPAEQFAIVVPGREHHASWYQQINHPDARLIAAAPDLLEALEECAEYLRGFDSEEPIACAARARAAIAKAKGEA